MLSSTIRVIFVKLQILIGKTKGGQANVAKLRFGVQEPKATVVFCGIVGVQDSEKE